MLKYKNKKNQNLMNFPLDIQINEFKFQSITALKNTIEKNHYPKNSQIVIINSFI
jgi:hypothetical protein